MRDSGLKIAATVLLACGAAAPAHAVATFFTGGTAVAGKGEISSFVSPLNVEEFTGIVGDPEFPCFTGTDIVTEQGGSGAGLLTVAKRKLNPAGNSTNCFAASFIDPEDVEGSSESGSYTFDFAPLAGGVLYMGFYWGSPDSYNSLRVFDGNGDAIEFFDELGNSFGTSLEGNEFTQTSSLVNGFYATNAANGTFVNFNFEAADNVQSVEFSTSSYAFEFDNISTLNTNVDSGNLIVAQNFAAVPAPGTLALCGFGLVAFAAARRRFN